MLQILNGLISKQFRSDKEESTARKLCIKTTGQEVSNVTFLALLGIININNTRDMLILLNVSGRSAQKMGEMVYFFQSSLMPGLKPFTVNPPSTEITCPVI